MMTVRCRTFRHSLKVLLDLKNFECHFVGWGLWGRLLMLRGRKGITIVVLDGTKLYRSEGLSVVDDEDDDLRGIDLQ